MTRRIVILIAFLILALLRPSVGRAETRYMRVYFIQWCAEGESSTYGEASYYEFPGADGVLGTDDDRNLLMDGGRSGSKNVLLSFLNRKIGEGGVIWNMACSSPGADHYGGLPAVVERYRVVNYYENVIWPRGEKPAYDAMIDDLESSGAAIYTYDAGDYLSGPDTTIGPGWDPYITTRVLCANAYPPGGGSDNAWSGLIQIRCGESVFLTGGDAIDNKQEKWVLNETVPHSYPGALAELAETDIYKVHHHGSAYSSDPDFLEALAPIYAVAQMAYGKGPGSRHHPRKEALDSIIHGGGTVYRNDLDGTVIIKCDSLGNFEITRSRVYIDESQTPGGSRDLVYPPPDLPGGLHATAAGTDYICLSWESVPGASGYDIYRSTSSDGDPGAGRDANPGCGPTGIYRKVNGESVTGTSYTDTGLTGETTYYYRISAKKTYSQEGYRVCYERRYSEEISQTTTNPTAPASPSPTCPSTPIPNPSPTGTPAVPPPPEPTPTPRHSDTPAPALTPTPRYSDTPTPALTPTPPLLPTPHSPLPIYPSGDYDGDGFSDIALFRPETGLWMVRDITRIYFGADGDTPVPADYDGDNTTEIAVFREAAGLWAIRSASRFYYGKKGDRPVPADYDGDGSDDCALFRPSAGRWLIRDISRCYFGTGGDLPLAEDWDGDGSADIGVFRPETGLWAIRDITRVYHGREGDLPVPGDCDGDGLTDQIIFRASSGLWAVRDGDRMYYGAPGDRPLIFQAPDYQEERIGLFRENTGLWAVQGVTRVYFGDRGDIPVTR